MRASLIILGLLGAVPLRARADAWDLWTNGTLHGANIYQRRVYPALDGNTFLGPGPVGPPYSQADFNALAARGANLVNLSHPGLYSETPPYALDTGVQSNLDRLVTLASNAGLNAVISFRTGPGRSEFSILREGAGDWFPASLINDGVWTNVAAQNAWTNMWKYAAQRYAAHPNVVGFDLMVEPNADDAITRTYDPAVFYAQHGGTLRDWNQLHPRIAAAIRSVNAGTPILIGGEDYSSLDWMPWLRTNGFPRVVYTAHAYDPHVYTHQTLSAPRTYPGVFDADEDNIPDTVNRNWLAARINIAAQFRAQHRVPVAINEFGLVRWAPGGAQFLDDLMGLLRAQRISSAIWMWHASWPAYNADDDEFNFLHGPNPAVHTDQSGNPLIRVIERRWRDEKSRAPVDFDGDGASDYGVYQPSSGNWLLSQSAFGTRMQNWGWNAAAPVPADYDGDGKCDIAVFHAAAGNWYIRRSSDDSLLFVNWGWSETRPVPADYDGDGLADVAVYHPASGNWYIRRSSNGTLWLVNWGWSAAAPVPADYTGDGRADIAVHFNGTWYIRRSENGLLDLVNFGGPGWAPVPGDYDGDGRADLAVWQPGAAAWFIRQSSNGIVRSLTAGTKNRGPAPADFDGDGRWDPGTYDASSAAWRHVLSLTGQTFARTWGAPASSPVRPSSVP